MKTRPASRTLVISGILIALLGLLIGGGGARLAALGGSFYYLAAGIGIVLTGLLLIVRWRAALWVYALVVLGTLGWAVYEIGFDWWQLAPRGDIIFLLGVYLLMPWITRRLPRGASLPLAATLLLAAAVGIVALLTNPHDKSGSIEAASLDLPANAGMPDDDWRHYGRTLAGDRYSPLKQIDGGNAGKLEVAWQYQTGDVRGPSDPIETTYEVTPIKVDDTLYLCTPHNYVIALDAESGQEKWRYDPKVPIVPGLQHLTCRGVAYHEAATATGQTCQKRIFMPTADARLLAIDATDGRPCQDFGQNGAVDLTQGMPNMTPGYYYSTSPPVVANGVVIVSGNVSDNVSTTEPSGVTRGFDVNTGKLLWNWDSGNPEATTPLPAGQHYTANSPNSWSVSSADEKLGLVYIPMGNQTPDQWGVQRTPQAELYSASIVALDIKTGKLRWVFQSVHHDLWDMDIGGQPSLVDLDTSTGRRQALIASTKRGDIYVLDRTNGQPIVPVHERPVPQGDIPDERYSPTQPFSDLTFLPRRPLEERDMWGATMLDQMVCRIMFKSARYEGIFTPPSTQGSIVYPGNFGVFDWGGVAIDPVRQLMIANPDYMAFYSRLIPRAANDTGVAPGEQKANEAGTNEMMGTPYRVQLNAFLSPLGLPCQAPPWGYMAGVDLRKSEIVWQHKNGTIQDSSPIPLPIKMGVPSLGGPITTGGGVAFLTSTLDSYIRAYDVLDGTQLWQARLPAGAQTTPMTYRSAKSGRQFVLVVAGGHGSLGTKAGDHVIAYALPKASS
ncbi:quinoprotein glucose dehydrogenase [Arboricoccus pini]|uniref:Quinoprotein glucose dehydrogenase n=1 Tax=Arboricoccus pini TaxID=1963835 RepID=A0A212QXH4_9PROT|nr:glucose/quinate/shikimate family membrane-bound PQQ-dependent dehydrogenase [Arboricoccus pini]SNB64321.1 quinoprotein glucose dehydrogenase [Arboricoccus pini]